VWFGRVFEQSHAEKGAGRARGRMLRVRHPAGSPWFRGSGDHADVLASLDGEYDTPATREQH